MRNACMEKSIRTMLYVRQMLDELVKRKIKPGAVTSDDEETALYCLKQAERYSLSASQ